MSALIIGLLAVAGTPATVAAASVVDATGDTWVFAGPGSTPAYLDIVGGAITEQDGWFEFSIDVAATVPDAPALPPEVKLTSWFWALDVDSSTFPSGYPRAPGLAFPTEFLLAVYWDGANWSALLADRRPTLTGGTASITPADLSVDGRRVSAFVPAAALDDPTGFGFRAYTRVWLSHPGTEGFHFTDAAPDDFSQWVPWP